MVPKKASHSFVRIASSGRPSDTQKNRVSAAFTSAVGNALRLANTALRSSDMCTTERKHKCMCRKLTRLKKRGDAVTIRYAHPSARG